MAMRKFVFRKFRRNPEAGMTMLEVLIAGVVMTIGFMGLIGLVATAIASNNRNKLDSTGTMLAQAVVEQINSTLVGSGTASLSDCGGNTWTIATEIGGASLSGANIDFTQTTVPTNYSMNFSVCSVGQTSQYDVRWNVQQITSETYLVTVGARLLKSGAGGNKYFALPVTLRTYVSP
jgi:Tfp pilus assembly protein PilV